MERRELLRWLVATAGLSCLEGLTPDELVALGAHVHRGGAPEGQPARALDSHGRQTVIAAADRIIPKTETPGATDAGVVDFIDKMLADWYSPEERDRFLNGLRELNASARRRLGKDFADSTERDQVALLTAIDEEVTALRRTNAASANAHWFAMLKYMTVFGYGTSEVAMRQTLGAWPRPTRYDACAPVSLRQAQGRLPSSSREG
jgi:hypothetical protein